MKSNPCSSSRPPSPPGRLCVNPPPCGPRMQPQFVAFQGRGGDAASARSSGVGGSWSGRVDFRQPRGSVAEARRDAEGREGLGLGSVLSPELVAQGECRWALCPHCQAHRSQAASVCGIELTPPALVLPFSRLRRGGSGRTPTPGSPGGSREARGVSVQPTARPCQEHDRARRAGLRRAAPSGLRSARKGRICRLKVRHLTLHCQYFCPRGNEWQREGPARSETFEAFLLGAQGK